MDKTLRAKIKDEAENLCKICGQWCTPGEPHHVVKISEEPLLRNCKTNVWWLCRSCHNKTETKAGYNRELQKQLQEYYYNLFDVDKTYSINTIAKKIEMPMQDMLKAYEKAILKGMKGIDYIRFLSGGIKE